MAFDYYGTLAMRATIAAPWLLRAVPSRPAGRWETHSQRCLSTTAISGHKNRGTGAQQRDDTCCARQEDAYAATVAKVRRLMDARAAKYAAADLHIPLENAPGEPGDVGAPPAVVAYR